MNRIRTRTQDTGPGPGYGTRDTGRLAVLAVGLVYPVWPFTRKTLPDRPTVSHMRAAPHARSWKRPAEPSRTGD